MFVMIVLIFLAFSCDWLLSGFVSFPFFLAACLSEVSRGQCPSVGKYFLKKKTLYDISYYWLLFNIEYMLIDSLNVINHIFIHL